MADTFEFRNPEEAVPEIRKEIVQTVTTDIQTIFRIEDLQEEINRIDSDISSLNARKTIVQNKITAAAAALNITL
jgi:predicted  nucleic acid-binding Zn-ribbon protein